jgi:hypothetical protein
MARTVLGFACAVLLSAATASAQFDLSGDWELEVDAFFGLVDGLPDCEFAGAASITQDDGDLGGTADLTLVAGDPECPAEMSADVDGTFDGVAIEMGLLMGGQLGTAQWSGGIVVAGSEGGQDGEILGLLGDFLTDSGPFAGTGGTWIAQRGAGPPVIVIPTLTTLGLIALVALLLAAAALMLRRRPAAESPAA